MNRKAFGASFLYWVDFKQNHEFENDTSISSKNCGKLWKAIKMERQQDLQTLYYLFDVIWCRMQQSKTNDTILKLFFSLFSPLTNPHQNHICVSNSYVKMYVKLIVFFSTVFTVENSIFSTVKLLLKSWYWHNLTT